MVVVVASVVLVVVVELVVAAVDAPRRVSAVVVGEELCVQAEAMRLRAIKSVMLSRVGVIGREGTHAMSNCRGTEPRGGYALRLKYWVILESRASRDI